MKRRPLIVLLSQGTNDKVCNHMQISSHIRVSVIQLSSCVLGIQALPEAQWINCDIRTFDMTVLGKFGVIMV